MTQEAHDYLMGSGGVSASFLEIGTVHKGEVISYEKRQQRDMISGEKKFWDDGDPMWQLVFTIQTEENDPEVDDDDGVRRIFAKAQMLTAIREAIRKSGHKGNLAGGTLAVKYEADGESKGRGLNPPKIYRAQFSAPVEVQAFEESKRDVESFEEDYAYTDGEEQF